MCVCVYMCAEERSVLLLETLVALHVCLLSERERSFIIIMHLHPLVYHDLLCVTDTLPVDHSHNHNRIYTRTHPPTL